jgi:hypothetical protein
MAITSLKSGISTRSGMAGNTFIYPGSYESIATTTVGAGGAGGIVFSSIPATFSHLQIRGIIRGNRSGALDEMGIRFNGGSANITYHNLSSNGSAASTAGATATGWSWFSPISSASQTSGVFSSVVIDILDYSSTNKYKVFRALTGYDNNGSGRIAIASGVQLDTAAINDVTIIPSNTTFVQYSQLSLYGIA